MSETKSLSTIEARSAPEDEADDDSSLPEALRALRHRNFRLFAGGQIISLTGTWMQSVAQSWLVYRLTGSAVLLGTVGFAGQIPVFLFAAFGGAIADNRSRILVVTQVLSMLSAFSLAALTLTNRIQVWHIFLFAAFTGIVNAFDIPARQAFVVDMVGRSDLTNAIALNSSMVNGARIVGPAVAGILVASVGEGWCFLINAVSYTAVIAGLLMMRLPSFLRATSDSSALSKIREGFQFACRTAPVRALLAGGLASRFGAPLTVMIGGVVCVCGAVVFGLRLPALRTEARRIIVAMEMAGGQPPDQMTNVSPMTKMSPKLAAREA